MHTLMRVAEHVWYFQGATGAANTANKGFMSNASFVAAGDGIVAFDALGRAAKQFKPFDDAYRETDWSRFSGMPAFAEANRINAFGTYLRREQEELDNAKATP